MKRKILFCILFLSMSLQFIFINMNFKQPKNIDTIIRKEGESIYERYTELKQIENLEIIKIEKENENMVSSISIKGNFNEVKNSMNKLDKYQIIDYKLEINKNEIEVQLSIA